MKHIIRYGTPGDHNDLIGLSDTYDMIVINANSVTNSENAVANFLVRNICVKENKSYYIDPITYAFQDHLELLHSKIKNVNKGQSFIDKTERLKQPIKPTFDKLINIYGEALVGIRKNIPLQPDAFLNKISESVLVDFCTNIINFQKNAVKNAAEKNGILKYLEYDKVNVDKGIQPKFAIAPYFYMDINQYREWIFVNVKLYEICQRINDKSIEIRMEIFIGKDILHDRDALTMLANRYLGTGCKGYILWVEDFEETLASQDEIENLLFFLEFFQGKSMYNAYGGFFSILLGHDAIKLLDGVSHGLEYGENRGGFPVGGGLPSSKYYFFPLHRRLNYLESFELLEKRNYINTNVYLWGRSKPYLSEICRCKICKELMPEYMSGFENFRSTGMYEVHYSGHTQRRTKATKSEKMTCRYHYMYCKKVEFKYVQRRKLDVILQDLTESEKKYRELMPLKEKIGTIVSWVDALKHMGE